MGCFRRTVLPLAAAALLLVGCGNDGEPAAGGDPERYCELTRKLDERFQALATTEAETQEEVQQAVAELVEDVRPDFQELITVAPADVRPELEEGLVLLERLGEGDLDALQELGDIDDTRSSAYETEHCR